MARMQAFSVIKNAGSFFSSVFSAWIPPSRLLHYPKWLLGANHQVMIPGRKQEDLGMRKYSSFTNS